MRIGIKAVILLASITMLLVAKEQNEATMIRMGSSEMKSKARVRGPEKIDKIVEDVHIQGSPKLSGNAAVWSKSDGNDQELYLYTGSQVRPITDNETDDINYQVAGPLVVWQARDMQGDYEIYLWDGASVSKITDNNYDDEYPQISGSNIAWVAKIEGDYEVFFWSQGNTVQLTDNNFDDTHARISGSNVVWQSSEFANSDIFFWNGVKAVKISDSPSNEINPVIEGNQVVWMVMVGDGWQLYKWSGSQVEKIADKAQCNPRVSNNRITWSENGVICLWENGRVRQLTLPGDKARNPRIGDKHVVWQGKVGQRSKVFAYDGKEIVQLTDNDDDNEEIAIDGNTVLWKSRNGKVSKIETAVLE